LTAFPRVLPVGGSALTVEVGDTIDPAVSARVRALDASLEREPIPGVLEAVPSYRSLLVVYDPRAAAFAGLAESLLARLAVPGLPAPEGRLQTVPTVYGGEDGPDLEDVAGRLGIAAGDVIALHTAGEWTALMLGFAPGFAYLGLLPPSLETPRRSTPRVRVPAGSVAVAGRQTAIYSVASPGGWNLIGRTSLRMFDPFSASPALILPGDRVRFSAVRELPEPSPAGSPPRVASAAAPAVEVVEAGLLTTVQDAGRPGRRRLGVTWAGPMDAAALADANATVGNPPASAALECTVVGPALRFLATTAFAWTGADLGPVLHRADLGAWPVPRGARIRARPGNVLAFTGRGTGCRAYVALAGGVEVPRVLRSRATDLGSGFGGFEGRPLRAGDLLVLGAAPPGEPSIPPSRETEPDAARVRVVLGPQADALEPESVARLLSEPWTLGADSDRIGGRLDGPRLKHRGPAEIVSDGMVPGCIQVPPDGRPIVMMADCPTTGGYPKVATVVAADLGRLAQAFPGETEVRFEAVDVSEASRLDAAGYAGR